MNELPPIDLSITIPCYNEARRLPGSLQQLASYVKSLPLAAEIIVVVERSSDGTAEIAAEIAARESSVTVMANDVRRGKGFALRTGVLRTRGAVVFTMDADLSVPVTGIGEFLQYLEQHPGVDVLVGNRQHPGSDIAIHQNALRERMGQLFNACVRTAVGGQLRDTQCGFKAFRHRAATEIFFRQTIDGFACDVEILMLADQLGFRVHDRPVRWSNSPESKVRLFRDPLRMLFDLVQVRKRVAASLKQHPLVKE